MKKQPKAPAADAATSKKSRKPRFPGVNSPVNFPKAFRAHGAFPKGTFQYGTRFRVRPSRPARSKED